MIFRVPPHTHPSWALEADHLQTGPFSLSPFLPDTALSEGLLLSLWLFLLLHTHGRTSKKAECKLNRPTTFSGKRSLAFLCLGSMTGKDSYCSAVVFFRLKHIYPWALNITISPLQARKTKYSVRKLTEGDNCFIFLFLNSASWCSLMAKFAPVKVYFWFTWCLVWLGGGTVRSYGI